MKPGKKPGLAGLMISFGKPHRGGDDGDHEDDEDRHDDGDDEDYEAARDELADVLDVPEDKRVDFGEALRAFVMTCK